MKHLLMLLLLLLLFNCPAGKDIHKWHLDEDGVNKVGRVGVGGWVGRFSYFRFRIMMKIWPLSHAWRHSGLFIRTSIFFFFMISVVAPQNIHAIDDVFIHIRCIADDKFPALTHSGNFLNFVIRMK